MGNNRYVLNDEMWIQLLKLVQVVVDSWIVEFYDPPVRAGAIASSSDMLKLAPNLDPSSVDPALLKLRHTRDLHTRRSLCLGKHVSILKGPRKGYRGTVVKVSRDDAFIVELEVIGQHCSVQWADLGLVW